MASDLVTCATGTDTGGSVRLPEAYCGLTGLKVSKNYLPTDGIYPLSHTLDTPGPMARSVADVALMLAVMRGAEAWAIDQDMKNGQGLFAFQRASVRGLKLGIIDNSERQVCDADMLKSYDAAVDRLASLGAQIAVAHLILGTRVPCPYKSCSPAFGGAPSQQASSRARSVARRWRRRDWPLACRHRSCCLGWHGPRRRDAVTETGTCVPAPLPRSIVFSLEQEMALDINTH